jgi:hypothetical protein
MGRKAIYGEPMTAAERQAKVRSQRQLEVLMALETLDGMERLAATMPPGSGEAMRLGIEAVRATLNTLK